MAALDCFPIGQSAIVAVSEYICAPTTSWSLETHGIFEALQRSGDVQEAPKSSETVWMIWSCTFAAQDWRRRNDHDELKSGWDHWVEDHRTLGSSKADRSRTYQGI